MTMPNHPCGFDWSRKPPRKRPFPVSDPVTCMPSAPAFAADQQQSTWRRERVVRCTCPEKGYAHVHCPCQKCQNSAVPPSVELNHWKKSRLLWENPESEKRCCIKRVVVSIVFWMSGAVALLRLQPWTRSC